VSPSAKEPTRVVLADAQTLSRAGLRALLEADSRISVVAEATTAGEAVVITRRLCPDVVLIDEELPGLDSIARTSRIVSESGVAVLLLVTSEASERHMLEALRAGASGVLLKDSDPAELLRAVELLAQGEALLSPSLTRHLIAELASRPEPAAESPAVLNETAREREIVALVALGLSNVEIAERLVVSPATAKTHVSRAMVKLHARDRAQLVVLAYKTGLVVPPVKPASNGRSPAESLD
jgi:DNA-binding NarL/FixJ family response regulator